MKNSKLKIVTLGAGTGHAKILLGLKKYFSNINAVVNVTDNGGHSGILREQLKIPQVGDGRQLLIALADNKKKAKEFSKRNANGSNKGNLYLAKIAHRKDIAQAFKKAGAVLKCQGQVIPSTIDNIQVGATLVNNKKIIGEWEVIKRHPRKKIKNIFLKPKAKGYPTSIRAIKKAEWIIISPGSLFTGVLPIFLPSGIKKAFKESKARVIYISNLMTMPGQTDGFSFLDHIGEIKKYSGRYPDFVVLNDGEIPKKVLNYYKKIKSYPIDFKPKNSKNYKIIKADLIPAKFSIKKRNRPGKVDKWTHWLTHDQKKLSKVLKQIITN